jgi:hypothetical protein
MTPGKGPVGVIDNDGLTPPDACPAPLDMEKQGVHNAPEPIDELGLIGDLTPAAVAEVQRPSSFVSRRHLRDVDA